MTDKQFLQCPYCKTLLPEHYEHCGVCGESQIIATVVCTSRIGKTQHGSSWLLFPRNYTIGKEQKNDIVIDTGAKLCLTYSAGTFLISEVHKDIIFHELENARKLKNGDTVEVSGGALKISYITDFEDFYKQTAEAARYALSASYLIQHMKTTEDVLKTYLDTVLEITGLEKGYVFEVNDQKENPEFILKTASSSERKNIDGRTYPISHTFLQKTIESDGNIIIIDAEKITKPSKSIKALKLKSIFCAPLLNTECRIRGILYADSLKKVSRKKLFYLRPFIKMLSDLTAKKLEELRPGTNGK